eukprot:TRINITY_DN1835_c3_g1_i2.p1 TRINITY_DN1835_c3_g1~~TRINITY_DN1835_c3_g1_i2.p1  ORF type:complete len:761 (+),score=221.06 TRINITY_DN1835_c3_g1_i2:93-2375(+)
MKLFKRKKNQRGQLWEPQDSAALDEESPDAPQSPAQQGSEHAPGPAPASHCTDVPAHWSAVQVPVEQLPPSVTGAGMASHLGDLYVFGGKSVDGYTDALHKLDVDAGRWCEVITHGVAPSCRSHAVVAAFEGKLFVIGGCDESRYFDDVFEFDIASGEWSKAPKAPYKVAMAAGLALKNRVILFGGCNGKKTLGDIAVFDMSSRAWVQKSGFPSKLPVKMKGHCAVATPSADIHLVLGVRDDGKPVSSATHLTWSKRDGYRAHEHKVAVPAEPSRENAVAVYHRGFVYVWGGSAPSGDAVDGLLRYSPATRVWKQVAEEGEVPAARAAAAAVATPAGLVLFGGADEEGIFADANVLKLGEAEPDELAESWVEVEAPVDAPAAGSEDSGGEEEAARKGRGQLLGVASSDDDDGGGDGDISRGPTQLRRTKLRADPITTEKPITKEARYVKAKPTIELAFDEGLMPGPQGEQPGARKDTGRGVFKSQKHRWRQKSGRLEEDGAVDVSGSDGEEAGSGSGSARQRSGIFTKLFNRKEEGGALLADDSPPCEAGDPPPSAPAPAAAPQRQSSVSAPRRPAPAPPQRAAPQPPNMSFGSSFGAPTRAAPPPPPPPPPQPAPFDPFGPASPLPARVDPLAASSPPPARVDPLAELFGVAPAAQPQNPWAQHAQQCAAPPIPPPPRDASRTPSRPLSPDSQPRTPRTGPRTPLKAASVTASTGWATHGDPSHLPSAGSGFASPAQRPGSRPSSAWESSASSPRAPWQ